MVEIRSILTYFTICLWFNYFIQQREVETSFNGHPVQDNDLKGQVECMPMHGNIIFDQTLNVQSN